MARANRGGLAAMARKWPFQLHDIRAQLDNTGHYQPALRRDFPLSVRLFHYRAKHFTRGVTWHEQLELFFVVSGFVQMRMGDQLVALGAGDLLIVDNLKLHYVVDRPDLDARVVVISFRPELVCGLGTGPVDLQFLAPFYAPQAGKACVVPRTDAASRETHAALENLVNAFLRPESEALRDAACKAHLLSLLLVLARRFHDADQMRREFERRRRDANRLGKLLAYIHDPGSPRLLLGDAARMSGMSPAQFKRVFRKLVGLPYAAYGIHVRLTRAAQHLRRGEHKIAEVATLTGFSDQSHFDRHFKRAFGRTPRQFQRELGST